MDNMADADNNPCFPFFDLPVELQLMVLCRASLPTVGACARTCSRLANLCQEEELWARLAARDYGMDRRLLPPASQDFSPRLFYRDVLHKYRRLLGLWQRHNLKHYGGLLRVSASGAGLLFEEILPPTTSVMEPLRPVLMLTVTRRRADATSRVEVNKARFSWADVNIGLVRSPELELHLTPVQYGTEQLREQLAIPLGFQVSPILLQQQLTLAGFSGNISYKRLCVRKVYPPSTRLPIWPGIFKGTYGTHGIELIHLVVPSKVSLLQTAGVKITGDPNVPFGETSFKLTNGQCLSMDQECLASFETIEAFLAAPAYHNYHEGVFKPFAVPEGCYQREKVNRTICKGLWSCECQIAAHNHQNPRHIPGIFVLFDEDLFAVIFLELQSISLYHRAELQ